MKLVTASIETFILTASAYPVQSATTPAIPKIHEPRGSFSRSLVAFHKSSGLTERKRHKSPKSNIKYTAAKYPMQMIAATELNIGTFKRSISSNCFNPSPTNLTKVDRINEKNHFSKIRSCHPQNAVKSKFVIPTAADDAVDVDHEEESDCQGEDKSDVHQLNQNGSVILLFKTFIRRH